MPHHPPGRSQPFLPVSEDFFLIEVCGFLFSSRTRVPCTHPDGAGAILSDRVQTSAIESSHLVEPMDKRPILGYFTCGTHTRQRQSPLSAANNSVHVWTSFCRRMHAERVGKVAVVRVVTLVHHTPRAASILSTGVPGCSLILESRCPSSVAEDLAGIRRDLCIAACMTL